jgi:hypothetical protein
VRTERAPEAKPGWLSGIGVKQQYDGVGAKHAASIKALHAAKLADLTEGGFDEVAARREVEEKWVAWARAKDGAETWYVSPAGLEELIRQGKVRTEKPGRRL